MKTRILDSLRHVDRFFESGVVLIFLLLVLIGALQVFNRFALNMSLSWSEEFQKFAHIWLVYLTIPVAYNRGSHIGVDLVLKLMPTRLRWAMTLLIDLAWIALAVAVIRFTLQVMAVARFQAAPGLGITFDWAYLGLVIGGGYLVFAVGRNIVCHVFGITDEREGLS